jgi:hypothetical protein
MPGRVGRGPAGSEIGTLGFGRADKGNDARLFNLTPYIPQEKRFSRIGRRRPELLDQILALVELFVGFILALSFLFQQRFPGQGHPPSIQPSWLALR